MMMILTYLLLVALSNQSLTPISSPRCMSHHPQTHFQVFLTLVFASVSNQFTSRSFVLYFVSLPGHFPFVTLIVSPIQIWIEHHCGRQGFNEWEWALKVRKRLESFHCGSTVTTQRGAHWLLAYIFINHFVMNELTTGMLVYPGEVMFSFQHSTS